MKIATVYVYPAKMGPMYECYAMRFIKCYLNFPPMLEHESIVMVNGARQSAELACLFSPLPNLRFIEHDNSGYDIGAFQHAARVVSCDMMVFFGASTYFQRAGWLRRMADAFQSHGNAQYGAMGNRGNLGVAVWPHIRTTAFWMDPKLMCGYPKTVVRPEQRHPFEHGPECFTNWVGSVGLKSWVVTWTRELLWEEWDSDPNGFSRGNQSSILAGDHLCERPYYPTDRCRTSFRQAAHCDPWSESNCWNCLITHP